MTSDRDGPDGALTNHYRKAVIFDQATPALDQRRQVQGVNRVGQQGGEWLSYSVEVVVEVAQVRGLCCDLLLLSLRCTR